MNAAHPVQKLYVPETCGVCSLAAVTAFHADRGCGRTYHRNRFPAGSESAACRGQDCDAGAIRTRRIHRYHHGTRPQMKRACLSETVTPVPRQAPQGLEAGSAEHTSALQSTMRISYALFCMKNN